MSLSAYSLLNVKFGTFVELRPVLKTCLDVFQNNFEFELALDSRPSSLSKYSFFIFLFHLLLCFEVFCIFPKETY